MLRWIAAWYTCHVHDSNFLPDRSADDESGTIDLPGFGGEWSAADGDNDLLELIDTPSEADAPHRRLAPWVIAIVDDDLIVHEVTKAVLEDFSFEGRAVEFLMARSAREAHAFFLERKDIAVAIIDVVMETETAGLDLVRFIREEAQCRLTRLVLRTGQPGLAPENQIIHRYDLHDYWEKTELSAKKLITVIHSALRAYRDLLALETSRQGIRKLLDLSPSLQACQSQEIFAKTAFGHFQELLPLPSLHGFVGIERDDEIEVLQSIGLAYEAGEKISRDALAHSNMEPTGDPGLELGDGALTIRLYSREHDSLVFRIEGLWELSEEDLRLLGLLRHQMETHLENLHLWLDALDAQLETIHLLADAVETRSKETGAHTQRVGELSWVLGKGLGLDPQRAEVLHRAAPLHDLGKIAIPDSVLNKPGKLTPEEWDVMKTHSVVGYEILSKSMRGPMQMAALIARDHHEKWDGSGYPRGIKEIEISLEGRIVALVDVVDALLSHRCYKKPWALEDVLSFVREQRGRHFDPEVVDAFFRHLPEIVAIRHQYADSDDISG